VAAPPYFAIEEGAVHFVELLDEGADLESIGLRFLRVQVDMGDLRVGVVARRDGQGAEAFAAEARERAPSA